MEPTDKLKIAISKHKGIQRQLAELLTENDKRKLWKKMGHSSLQEYAEKELGYSTEEFEEIMDSKSNVRSANRKSRFAQLIEAINQKFENLSPDDLDKIQETYDYSVVEMFQVTKIQNYSIELMHLFDDELYEPVTVPPEILKMLRKGDTFLMMLGLKNHVWEARYISAPYY